MDDIAQGENGLKFTYGENGFKFLDRLNQYVGMRAVRKVVRRYFEPCILDIGCGYSANYLRHLLPWIRSGTGIDYRVGDAVKANPKFRFFEGPIEKMLGDLQPGSFDCILMFSVLEHLWEPQSVLDTVYDLLRPGGTLIINLPTWWAKPVLEFLVAKLNLACREEVDDHKTYYNKRDLWPCLVRAGWRPLDIRLRYYKFGMCLFGEARIPINAAQFDRPVSRQGGLALRTQESAASASTETTQTVDRVPDA